MLTRRQLLTTGAIALTAPALTALAARAASDAATTGDPGPAEVEPQQRLRVGLLVLTMPEGGAPSAVPAGWDWAAETSDGIQLLVIGRSAAPTPELALASVLATNTDGRFGLRVTGHPPVSVAGAQAHRVWTVRTTGAHPRTGNLVAATLGGETAIALLTGPEGWSPSARRSVLSSLEVSRDG